MKKIEPINNNSNGVNTDHSNWKDKLDEERKFFETSIKKDLLAGYLEEQYLISQEKAGSLKYRDDIKKYRNPLEALYESFDWCFYPPPELIAVINQMYQTYLNLEGKVSLDEIFFGASKKGIGNYSAQKKQIDLEEYMYLDFLRFNLLNIKNELLTCLRWPLLQFNIQSISNVDGDLSLSKVDQQFINKKLKPYIQHLNSKNLSQNLLAEIFVIVAFPEEEVDVESFKRNFRRWKKSNFKKF